MPGQGLRDIRYFWSMGLYITSLNSGSNGNCYYVGNQEEAILVDAGITLKETEKRMERLGLPMNRVKAIFISHEHADHITGLPALSKKYQIPVYITRSTLSNSRVPVEKHLVRDFNAAIPVNIGRLLVKAFVKVHDAIDPHSFMISQDHIRIGVFTDIGQSCKDVIQHFRICHAVFLESNYCEDMLANGRYPFFLKQRISGGQGHLSNREALDLFMTHRSSYLSHLILSHLSSNNNKPELVNTLFTGKVDGVNIVVASRYAETQVFHVEGGVELTAYGAVPNADGSNLSSGINVPAATPMADRPVSVKKRLAKLGQRPGQLSLFDL